MTEPAQPGGEAPATEKSSPADRALLLLPFIAVALTTVWLPWYGGGRDQPQLGIVQAVTLGVLVFGIVVSRGRPKGLNPVEVITWLIGLAAVVATAFSLSLDASVPQLFLYIWLAALSSLIPRLCRGRARELTIFLLIAAGVSQVAFSFFIWSEVGNPHGFHYGTFYAPNQYAGYIGMLAPLLLIPFFASRNPLRVFLWGFLGLFVYLGIFLTGSRAGVGAATVGALVTAGIAARKSLIPTVIKTVGLVLILVALSFGIRPLIFPDRVPLGSSSATDFGQKNRIQDSLQMRFLWADAAISSGVDRPVTGAGPGTFGMRMFKFQKPQAAWAKAAHNQYLEAWNDGGAFLFLGLVLLPFIVVWKVGGHWDRAHIESVSEWDAGLLGGVVAGSVHMLFDTDWIFPAFSAVFVIICSLLVGRIESRRRTPKAASAATGIVAAAALVAVTAGLVADFGGAPSSSDAESLARRASLLKPYSAQPFEFLANRLAGDESRQALLVTRDHIQSAIRLKKIEPSLWWRLADVESKLGRTAAARSAYEHAERIGPYAVRLYLLWSAFELKEGNAPRALELSNHGLDLIKGRFDEARLIETTARLLVARARAELAIGDPQAALSSAVEATRVAPNKVDAWAGLAEIGCGVGDTGRAAEARERAVKLGFPAAQLESC